MKRWVWAALGGLATQIVFAGESIAAPLEAYGRLPFIEAVSISPDGQKLAMILTTADEHRIAIQNLPDGPTKLLGAGKAKVRALAWAGANHLLITATSTTDIPFLVSSRAEWATTSDYNLATGKMNPLLDGAIKGSNEHLSATLGLPEVRILDGRPVAFVAGMQFVNNVGRLALIRVDLDSGREEMIESGYPNTRDWLVGQHGEPLAQSQYFQEQGRWSLWTRTDSGWRQLHVMDAPIDGPWIEGLGRDGTSILVAEPLVDTVALREIDPSSPKWGEPFRKQAYSSTIHDPKTLKLIGFRTLVGEEDRYEFFESANTSAWAEIRHAFVGKRVTLADWSEDRNRIVVRIDAPSSGPSYALVDLTTMQASAIGDIYQSLTPADVSERRPVRYKATDGLEITAYLTLPRGRPAKDLPLVVLPHGGPESRDEPGFDWWSQALASRGYAVLQPNFRGSAGFGLKFTEAGYGEWGRKMQTDLSDGVRYLAAAGTVDPKRVCIVGASYGGYAALAGAAFDTSTYRCAASVAGPADMPRMVTWSKREHGERSQRYWTRFMGADDRHDPILKDISPALHAEQITIPVLLVHGKDDTVVPLEQTKVMEKALKEADKSVETLIMPGEDHWLSRGETRLQMLTRVVAFLETHNPPN